MRSVPLSASRTELSWAARDSVLSGSHGVRMMRCPSRTVALRNTTHSKARVVSVGGKIRWKFHRPPGGRSMTTSGFSRWTALRSIFLVSRSRIRYRAVIRSATKNGLPRLSRIANASIVTPLSRLPVTRPIVTWPCVIFCS
jgi:hypothetical protein